MNPGGEPERDDTGLPPVDVEVPDDARELDPDVQAYFRELRANRRARRRARWHSSLARDGIVLPLLASFLIFALIAGTLLTVFSATTGQNLPVPPGSRAGPAPGASQQAGAAPLAATVAELPDATITVAGRQPVQVRALSQAVLVLVPPGCDCATVLNWLGEIAAGARARATYLVATRDTAAEVARLYRGLDSQVRPLVTVATDTAGQLQASTPAGIPAGGLTAVLIGPTKLATFVTRLSPDDDPSQLAQALAG